ncbi:MAG: hypothetical protein HY011_35350 [Acidobacteria bacterium]|nr:hypothetical protein [Acidobacteriota bacterium]
MTFDQTQWPAYLALLGAALTCWALACRLRQTERQQQTSITALGQRLMAVEGRLRRALEQSAEQARRMAWLELHLHQSRTGAGPLLNVKANGGGKVTSMTERRHRVLVLARRGMTVETIAETLGVPKGEVELIISLHSLKAAA